MVSLDSINGFKLMKILKAEEHQAVQKKCKELSFLKNNLQRPVVYDDGVVVNITKEARKKNSTK